VIVADPKYEVAYQGLMDLLKKHADEMTALEMLAVAANMVGKLIAMQDQRKVSSDMAMDVVARNLEIGNRQALASLRERQTAGSA
jgi:hypothetical protein